VEEEMSGPVITKLVEIEATPERVWQALTDPEQTALCYYGGRISSDWQPGGPVQYIGADGSVMISGTLLEFAAPRRLITTFSARWEEASAADRPSRVSYTIEPRGSGSRVTLVHDDFDGETATYHGVNDGWDYILAGLKSVIETGKPLPVPTEA
jgi:uncharacterized protein YndB with AHSA1/START domain